MKIDILHNIQHITHYNFFFFLPVVLLMMLSLVLFTPNESHMELFRRQQNKINE